MGVFSPVALYHPLYETIGKRQAHRGHQRLRGPENRTVALNQTDHVPPFSGSGVIQWPSEVRQRLEDVGGNRVVTIEEAAE